MGQPKGWGVCGARVWVGERDVSVLVALDGCFGVVGKGGVGMAGVGGG